MTTQFQRWTEEDDKLIGDAFGKGTEFLDYIADRTAAYLDHLDQGRLRHIPVADDVIGRAVKMTDRNRAQVLTRLTCIVRRDLGLSIDESKRGARRDVLREYARRGIRTLSGVLQADKAAASPQPEQLPLPAPAVRTLDVIAAELREAKYEQVRAEVAASVARSRVEALRAELRAAVEEV